MLSIEQIVKAVVTDPTLVEVVPIIDAHATERRARSAGRVSLARKRYLVLRGSGCPRLAP